MTFDLHARTLVNRNSLNRFVDTCKHTYTRRPISPARNLEYFRPAVASSRQSRRPLSFMTAVEVVLSWRKGGGRGS